MIPFRWTGAGPALLAASLLAGCASPAYYAQAVSGHFSRQAERLDIDAYLAGAESNDPIAQRLETARDLLAYADEHLGLPSEGGYRSFTPPDEGAVTWNVVATPSYSLDARRWCFLVAGCVPYRGYFDHEDAERFAGRMRDRGMDVSVSAAGAYSTLGWFDDPIPGAVLEGPETRLADTLFHELAHQALYVKGDTTFNESYATFVARRGVHAWLEDTGRDDALADWQTDQQAADDFRALLADTRASLAALYADEGARGSLAAGKAERFAALEQRYRALVNERWEGRDRFGGWFEPPPNNADLALFASYTGGLCAFDALWREAGQDFRRFHALARARGAASATERAAWLKTPCP